MITSGSKIGSSAAAAAESTQALNSPLNTGGAGESGGLLSEQKDSKEAATAPKFGDLYKEIQAKYGAKPEKPREIKKTLGKDDFLKIMMTQMKNQDPTNPFKAEQMATEIAQFTSVEQLANVNQNLAKMANQNKPLEQMSMTNLIGKMVTVDRQRFPHNQGESDEVNFNLPRDAASVNVVVENEIGEELFQKDLGKQKAGEVAFVWDGIMKNTLPSKAGNFKLRVDAKDMSGKVIDINPQVQAKVIGVSFEGNEPVFLVGDARHQDKVTMKNIVRIELESPASASDPKSPHSTSATQPKSSVPTSNLITFQKGVGSGTFGPGSIAMGAGTPPNPEVLKTLEKFQESEKGFPNGLHDSEDPNPAQGLNSAPQPNPIPKGGDNK